MQERSSKPAIIFGIVLILVVIGVIIATALNNRVSVSDTYIKPEPVATSTPTNLTPQEEEWITFTSTSDNFRIDFKSSMTELADQKYPPVPNSNIKATVFKFPKSLYAGGTIKEASVSVARTSLECSQWPDNENAVAATSTNVINGINYEYRIFGDAGAGNFYLTREYSTTKNNYCYRIVLFTHSTNPGIEADNETEMQILTEKNKEIDENFETIFDHMVATFEFTK
jgi:hypothetical protein